MEYWERTGHTSRKSYLSAKRKYYQEHKEKIKRDAFIYQQKNKKVYSDRALCRYRLLAYDGNRKLALERDGYKCQRCFGLSGNPILCVHHKDENGSTKRKDIQNNGIENLITLCNHCHSKLHRFKQMGKELEFSFF